LVAVGDGDLRALLPLDARECSGCGAVSWVEELDDYGILVGCLFRGEA